MAKLYIGYAWTDGSGQERQSDLTDAQLGAIVAAITADYFPNGVTVPAVTDDDGKIVTPASIRPPTKEEIFSAFASGFLQGLADKALSHARLVAAQQAAEQVAPIDLSLSN